MSIMHIDGTGILITLGLVAVLITVVIKSILDDNNPPFGTV